MWLLLAALAPWTTVHGSDGVSPPEVRRLVRQLTAVEYSERQAAAQRLLEIGTPALDALRRAQLESDPELRARSNQLLQQVRDQHYETLLDRLVAASQDLDAAGLPGWRRLTAIAADTPETRQLYRGMLRADPELLQLMDERPNEVRTALEARTAILTESIRLGRHEIELGVAPEELAVLLLATVACDVGYGFELPEYLLRSPPLPPYDQLQEQTELAPLRSLLGAWVLTPQAGSRRLRMSVGKDYRLPESLQPAREAAADPQATVRERQDAVVLIARYGGVEHVPDLESLLVDRSAVQTRPKPPRESRVQDVALAALLHLTAQNPTDYGLGPFSNSGDAFDFSFQAMGFASDDERNAALRKWRVWRAVKLYSPLFSPLDAIAGTTL